MATGQRAVTQVCFEPVWPRKPSPGAGVTLGDRGYLPRNTGDDAAWWTPLHQEVRLWWLQLAGAWDLGPSLSNLSPTKAQLPAAPEKPQWLGGDGPTAELEDRAAAAPATLEREQGLGKVTCGWVTPSASGSKGPGRAGGGRGVCPLQEAGRTAGRKKRMEEEGGLLEDPKLSPHQLLL